MHAGQRWTVMYSAPSRGRSAGALRVGAGASSVGREPAMDAQAVRLGAPGTAAVVEKLHGMR
jgi:hypothetical protein